MGAAAHIEVMSTRHSKQARVPQGVPTGGEFAVQRKGEAGLSTLGGPPASKCEEPPRDPERIRLAGFVPPASRDELWSTAWEVGRGGRVEADRLERLRTCFPAMSDDEIVSAVEELASIDSEDYDEQRTFIESFALEEQARRGLHPADPPAGRVESNGPNEVGYTGTRYRPGRTITEVATELRSDIKEARVSGYLPSDLTYSVRTNKFSGGTSMRVSVRGLSDDQIYEKREEPGTGYIRRHYTPETEELRRRLGRMIAVHNYDRSDSMVDYFDTGFYSHVEIEDESDRDFRLAEAERRKSRRQAS